MQTQAASLRIDSPPSPSSAEGCRAVDRYCVDVLTWAEVGEHGVTYLNGSRRETLQWASVLRGLAAEVGEPEGVRTVVFDLVVELKAHECVVCRFDAEPGLDAQEVAMQIAASLGRERCSRSLAALAAEGQASRQVSDLDDLAELSLTELGL
jgi:hypothetical protein